MLILSTLGKGKEVVVSRGELVEIGGKFRVPDVMEQSGAKLVEVGTTNKTHFTDYEQAITEETSALLKVHTSNYRIVGFTDNVPIADLVPLGEKYDIPVVEDLGSGVLIDLGKYGWSMSLLYKNPFRPEPMLYASAGTSFWAVLRLESSLERKNTLTA